ncbi:hypothetical protein ACJ41O_010922 [Fusarium nematophilum]
MSSPANIRALAVLPQAPGPSTPEKKRKITPSAAQSSPKRSLILVSPTAHASIQVDSSGRLSVSPFFAPKPLFPGDGARVSQEFELPNALSHPSSGPSQEQSLAWQSRHVLLPFDLRDESLNILENKEIRNLLFNIFPGTIEVGEARCRSYLYFDVKEMPKEPWPLTVGGLPITISARNATRGRGPLFPMTLLRWGNTAISICRHLDGIHGTVSDDDLRSVAAELYHEIRARSPEVHLIEVMFTSERLFYVVLGNETDMRVARILLPGRIANCTAGYFLDRELNRPAWAQRKARRDILPQPSRGIADDTAYDVLRPGVMVCSAKKTHAHPVHLRTTSGVMVKNSIGDRFITAASHGIGEEETIFQSITVDQKRLVGKAIHEITFTDVAIVKLNDDIQFVNELFENESGTVTQMTRLLGENQGDELKMTSMVFINSPFTGSMEGSIVMKSAKIEHEPPIHPAEESLRYVLYNWIFVGQVDGSEDPVGPHVPPDGTCGSIILDDQNRAVGFFQYYIGEGRWAGFCASVNASEVVRAGYRLA